MKHLNETFPCYTTQGVTTTHHTCYIVYYTISNTPYTMADESKEEEMPFTLKGTMLEALLSTDVGSARQEVEVAPDTLGVLHFLQGVLLTPETMDRLLVSPQQVLVATINMLRSIPSLCEHVTSLVNAVEESNTEPNTEPNTMPETLETLSESSNSKEEVLGVRLFLKGTLVTPTTLDRLLVSPEQVLVAIINMLCKFPSLCEHVASLIKAVEGPKALAAINWKSVMTEQQYGDIPEVCWWYTMAYADKDGHTLLDHAIMQKKEEVALSFLQSEFGEHACGRINCESGKTALMLACCSWDTMEGVALKMLEFGAEVCNLGQANNKGETALIWACHSYAEGAALQILEFGPEACMLVGTDAMKFTALAWACRRELESVALKMLEFGAEACMLRNVSYMECTAIMWACKRGLEDAALKMLEFGPKRCSLGQVNNWGETALTYACDAGLEDTALKMVEFGPEACTLGHVSYSTVLYCTWGARH